MNGERSQLNTLYKSSKHYTTPKIMKADLYNKKMKNRKGKNELIFIAGFSIFALSSAYFFFANGKSEGINSAFLVSFVTLASYALMWEAPLLPKVPAVSLSSGPGGCFMGSAVHCSCLKSPRSRGSNQMERSLN